MISFETAAEAQAYVRDIVDLPVPSRQEMIGQYLQFQAFSEDLGGVQFTNAYDISYPSGLAEPTIHVVDQLKSVHDHATQNPHIPVVTTGGFFFLADRYSSLPRQLALNLAMADGLVYSFPVTDREAVLSNGRRLSAEPLRAMGLSSMNGVEMSWAGSLTEHSADTRIFGSGNSIITHEFSDVTGYERTLAEHSRFTPPIEEDELVDVGFMRREDGTFVELNVSREGNMDIFTHDVVVRCREKYLSRSGSSEMVPLSIDTEALDGSLIGAISVGPALDTENFNTHPINNDRSLGSRPPFLERPLARTALFETDSGITHIRLFDGRPGSEQFPGVTPSETVELIHADANIAWGCFLDPGQTAKLCVRTGEEIESHGNRHYLRWPTYPDERFV